MFPARCISETRRTQEKETIVFVFVSVSFAFLFLFLFLSIAAMDIKIGFSYFVYVTLQESSFRYSTRIRFGFPSKHVHFRVTTTYSRTLFLRSVAD